MAATTNPAQSTSAPTRSTKTSTAAKPAAKKATRKATATKTTAKKTAARKTATEKAAAEPAPARLIEREPKVVLEEAGYAMAGIAADAVELAKRLPGRFVKVRSEVEKVAEEAPERVRSLRDVTPDKLRSHVEDVRQRVGKDLEAWLVTFEKALESKAGEGRKVAEAVRSDERVRKVLDQTSNTRSQVKAAVTSARKTAETVAEVAKDESAKEA